METLKISELSVGDWVQNDYGNYVKVAGIWQGRNFNYHVDIHRNGVTGTILPCNLHPIPITAELLEKNGWKLSKSNWFEFEDGEWKINIWIGKSKCNIEISQKREIYAYTYADIQVVKSNINTLQHALRFAGIDKEINL